MNIILLCFLLCLYITSQNQKDPILELDLFIQENKMIETTFQIGGKKVKANIDFQYDGIDICCKPKNSILQKIYFFVINPFFQNQDYSCQNSIPGSKLKDFAKFQRLGPTEIVFKEVIYPKCSLSKMGLNKNSHFIELMPKDQRFLIIKKQKNSKRQVSNSWKIFIGGKNIGKYFYKESFSSKDWQFQTQKLMYDQHSFQKQKITLISNQYHLLLPSQIFDFIVSHLRRQFQCKSNNDIINCPCERGISQKYPKFTLKITNDFTMEIPSSIYMVEDNGICSTFLKKNPQQKIEINMLLFPSINLLLNFKTKKMGFIDAKNALDINENIQLPLQLILNCVVILLMCVFVAMVLIEIIKRISDIENASNDNFQIYMMKRNE